MCIKSLVKYAMIIVECSQYNEIYTVSELEVKELALCVAVLEDVEAGFAIEKIREEYFKNNQNNFKRKEYEYKTKRKPAN